MNRRLQRSSRVVLWLGLLLVVGGTAGFMLFKGAAPGEALYQTLVILISHFYHVINEELPTRLLILALMVGGLVLVAYLIKWFVEYIIEGELRGGFARRRMDKKLNELVDHYIVVGLGRVGRQIAEELEADGVPFVAADRDQGRLERAAERGWLTVSGDATQDLVLERAGARRARTMVVATGSDADNVFITLGARSLAPELFIVARANALEAIDKLQKAGANRVAMPHRIGGYHMATMALRPAVVDFLDVIIDNKHRELRVEEILVGPRSPLVGKPLSSYLSRNKAGTTVLAINRQGEPPIINPDGESLISAGDRLIVMGTYEQLREVAGIG